MKLFIITPKKILVSGSPADFMEMVDSKVVVEGKDFHVSVSKPSQELMKNMSEYYKQKIFLFSFSIGAPHSCSLVTSLKISNTLPSLSVH